MRPANDKIIVRVNMGQKDSMTIGGVTVKCANNYSVNYREKSPVVACVVTGNAWLREDDIILCHHNHFYHPSPYYISEDMFSIPANKTIFAIVAEKGLMPLYGNIICERVDIETEIPLPPEHRKQHIDRAVVVNSGVLEYKTGEIIFHRPNAGYDIVYMRQGIETKVTKVHDEMVCGVIRK